ncbi:MAG: OmpA family protein [Bacteroidales bacterium]|nr:OmpA family protein [Bacteroidales bacterium]
MKRTLCLILATLMLGCGAEALAQNRQGQARKNSKKQQSPYVEGRQKVRESDFATYDKFTTFSTKSTTVYYTPYNYMDIMSVASSSRPDWGELQPVVNYVQKVSRATMTMCAIYAINPDITNKAEREALAEQARNEALAALDAFNGWKVRNEMRNKFTYKVAEIDYRYFKGANYFNSQRGDDIIHVGMLLYFGSKKKALFAADTASRTFPDIKFLPNDATILESWNPVLDDLAEYLIGNDRKGVLLAGHADNQGTADYCVGISRQRAMEIKKALQLRGVEASRIEIEAKGDTEPIGDNSTYEGRVANNRVSIKIQ